MAAREAEKAVEVIQGPERASSLLHPLRRRILELLREPRSAADVARDLGMARQKVNYHVRRLEEDDLVEHVEDRPKGNMRERVVRATAEHFVISPAVLGALGAPDGHAGDRFSASYLVAASARTIRDVASLQEGARKAGKRLPTLTLETEVRVPDPASQHAFAEELVDAVARVVARYHDEEAEMGRTFRIAVGGHPALPRGHDEEERT